MPAHLRLKRQKMFLGLPPLQLGTFSVIPTGEHEVATHANAGHKMRE